MCRHTSVYGDIRRYTSTARHERGTTANMARHERGTGASVASQWHVDDADDADDTTTMKATTTTVTTRPRHDDDDDDTPTPTMTFFGPCPSSITFDDADADDDDDDDDLGSLSIFDGPCVIRRRGQRQTTVKRPFKDKISTLLTGNVLRALLQGLRLGLRRCSARLRIPIRRPPIKAGNIDPRRLFSRHEKSDPPER